MNKEDIKDWIVFEVLVGSHAYGTNIEGSDEDIKGVYIQPPEDVLERGYQEQISISKDETYYELRRFIELCCTNNPTMLELLYSPEDCIIYKHSIMDKILANKDKFLSKSCRWSFGGYAISQIEKASGLEKKLNWEKDRIERKDILDFCYITELDEDTGYYPGGSFTIKEFLDFYNIKQEWIGLTCLPHFRNIYNVFLDFDNQYNYKGIVSNISASNDISLSSIPKGQKRIGILHFNKDQYSVHCKEYNEYQKWLENRNTERYVDIENHGQKIDGKNLLHCVRLLDVGIEVAKEKTINVRRPNAKYLIEIRRGKHNLENILKACKERIEELDTAYKESTLPDTANRSFFMSLLPKLRKEFYDSNNSPT